MLFVGDKRVLMFLRCGIEIPDRWYYLFRRELGLSCFSQNSSLAGMLCFLYRRTSCLGAFGLMLANMPYASQLNLLARHQPVLNRLALSGSRIIVFALLSSLHNSLAHQSTRSDTNVLQNT